MAATNDHPGAGSADLWPALRYDDWKDTCATLQLWTQVIGKINHREEAAQRPDLRKQKWS